MFQMESPASKSILAEHAVSPSLVPDGLPQWFAVYTTPRHEKHIARHFDLRGIAYFLPLYQTQRKWKNGVTVSVELPLFPNYIFVRIDRCRRGHVLEVPGVLSIVGGRHPAALPEIEIESLRAGVQLRKFEPHPYLVTGEKVRIRTGPLAGMFGVLLRNSNRCHVVVTVEQVMRSVVVEVESNELEFVSSASIA
jgi:transcription antitermination factor NusG